ncbi:unnamed protein product [Ilex paraguariensis]|uniref:Uncharacterized protein n=1 Tax=Ilex paraguariensis TaxID=185542 RepID=A0ABC8U3Q9_9AQUA
MTTVIFANHVSNIALQACSWKRRNDCFLSSLGGPILIFCAEFLNFLTILMILTGSASPVTVAVSFDGSRTIEFIPSIFESNFITFFLHFEQSRSMTKKKKKPE